MFWLQTTTWRFVWCTKAKPSKPKRQRSLNVHKIPPSTNPSPSNFQWPALTCPVSASVPCSMEVACEVSSWTLQLVKKSRVRYLYLQHTLQNRLGKCIPFNKNKALVGFEWSTSIKMFSSSSLRFTDWLCFFLLWCMFSDKPVGRIVLGSFMFARGKELEHWNEMIANQKEQISSWLTLT